MAKKVVTGSQLRVAMWHQTTWESETPGTAYEMPVSMEGAKFGETVELLDSMVARSGRKEAKPYTGVVKADDLTFTIVGHYISIVHWLKHILGATVTTTGASAPYTHGLEVEALPPAFGLEVALVNSTAAQSKLWTCYGCRVKAATLPFAGAAGEIKLQVTISARKVTKTTGTPMTATTLTEDPILFNHMSAFTINSVAAADIIEGSLKFELEGETFHTANNSGRVGMYSEGRVKVRGSMRAMFHDDETYLALAEAGTYFPIVATFASGDNGMTLDAGACRLSKPPISVSGPQGIAVDLEFGAYEDPADADSPIVASVDNSDDGAGY